MAGSFGKFQNVLTRLLCSVKRGGIVAVSSGEALKFSVPSGAALVLFGVQRGGIIRMLFAVAALLHSCSVVVLLFRW